MALTYSLTATREGFVLIPQAGQVPVTNLSLEQLRSVLYTRQGRVYSGVQLGADATTYFDNTVANVGAGPPEFGTAGTLTKRVG